MLFEITYNFILKHFVMCHMFACGVNLTRAGTQWQTSPLTAKWTISKAGNTTIHHAGLSITIYFEDDGYIKGHDIYTLASILLGLWFLFTFRSSY